MNAAPIGVTNNDRPGTDFRHFLAAEVRAQMARDQVSNRRFAAQFGLKPAWVDRRLNGTTPLDADDMQFFADAFGIPLTELLSNALRRADESRAQNDAGGFRVNRG